MLGGINFNGQSHAMIHHILPVNVPPTCLASPVSTARHLQLHADAILAHAVAHWLLGQAALRRLQTASGMVRSWWWFWTVNSGQWWLMAGTAPFHEGSQQLGTSRDYLGGNIICIFWLAFALAMTIREVEQAEQSPFEACGISACKTKQSWSSKLEYRGLQNVFFFFVWKWLPFWTH